MIVQSNRCMTGIPGRYGTGIGASVLDTTSPKGVSSVPTYVSLINWTDQGVANFKNTVTRADDAKRAAAGMGGTIKDIYWTVGPTTS
jgi:hypothetical protein